MLSSLLPFGFSLGLAPSARASELHLVLMTNDGLHEQATWESTDTFSKRYGPVTNKGASVVYVVTVPSAVYDPLDDAFHVEMSVCVEWSKGKKSDQYCQRDDLLAPRESVGPNRQEIVLKAAEKFAWSVSSWFSGESPVPAGVPIHETEASAGEGDPTP